MSVFSGAANIIKRYFLSGVLVVVPVILTYLVLRLLFSTVDDILQPVITKLFGFAIPGLGLVTTLVIIIIAGIITRNFLGAQIYHLGDRFLNGMPLVRPVYSAAKQLLEAMAGSSSTSFKEVALVEYPRVGIYAIGFITHRLEIAVDGSRDPYIAVFIPSTPTPMTGNVALVPADKAYVLDMTVEQGVKYLVSGGAASPDLIHARHLSRPATTGR